MLKTMIKIIPIAIALLAIFAPAAAEDTAHTDKILSTVNEPQGGDFLLYSSQGEFSLEQQRGKVVLLYFGYSKCPDVCPTTLSTIAQALNELSEEELEYVQGVFVSVDPKRDSYQLLEEYVSYFHPNLIGVTGSESEIAEVAKRYGALYEEVTLEDSDFGYAVNHSADTYLITPEGELRFMFPHGTPSFVILEAIRYLLGSKR